MVSIDMLISQLGDRNIHVRRKAERELEKVGKHAVHLLINGLESENWSVRCRATSALGNIKDTRAIEPLIQRFADDQQVQLRAAVALGRIGKPAVDPLLRAMENDSWEVREGAVMALGKIGAHKAVEPLISSLMDDRDSVRWRAVIALGEIGDPRAVEPLIQAFKDEAFLVRWYASSALGKTGAPAVELLLQALQDAHEETRYGAALALRIIKSSTTVEPLIQALEEDEYMQVRLSAAIALGNIGDVRAVQPLIMALKDDHTLVRLHAAEALGKIGDSRAVEPLLEVFQDDEYAVRKAAAIAITKLGDPLIGPILRKMKLTSSLIHNGIIRTRERKRFSGFVVPLSQAWREGDDITRMAAALALSVIGGPRPIVPLSHLFTPDKNEDVRMAAVESLGGIGRLEAKALLKQALNDRLPGVRSKATSALAFLRDKSAVAPLLQALRDEDKEVRWYAAESLGFLGGGNRVAERVIRTALENVEDGIREEAAHALEKMEEEQEHEALYAEILEV